ncbi:MAG: hypothetical protein V2I26_15245, partial [Halieaceae bacterium]|nr:hypothetical protein [Halieaceae bacterium]
PICGENDEICFPDASNRHFDNLENILGAYFTGVLQSDGYGAYGRFIELVQGVSHAGLLGPHAPAPPPIP